jgi:predicted nucleotidyltransferase
MIRSTPMSENLDDSSRAAAEDFTTELAALWRAQIGSSILGIYRIGSLAHGGFSRRYSDIDVAIISETGLTRDELDKAREAALRLSAPLGAKLSIFWADWKFSLGRFPPLDRIDYLDHGVPLIERERVQPDRPSMNEVRTYLRGQPLEAWGEQARRFGAVTTLGPADQKPYLRTLLYPARFFYSWMTGRMASNDTAVAFLVKAAPPGIDIDVIARALRFRQEARDLDAVLPDRVKLPGLLAGCLRIVEGTES